MNFGKFDYSRLDTEKPVVIVGAGELARLAAMYFDLDSPYSVSSYVVDDEFELDSPYGNLPCSKFSEMLETFPSQDFQVFVAFSARKMSNPRLARYNELKVLGYSFASYVSSYSFFAPDAEIGENSFIFEDNTIQSGVKIGNATILWSGNHIGHQTTIGNGVFISSHVAIGGRSHISNTTYFGMNSTVRDEINIGPNTLVGANSYVNKSFEGGAVIFGTPAKPLRGVDPLESI